MADVPNDNHVARHCRHRNVQGTNVSGKEFELKLKRDPPESYLSVNWMEATGKSTIDDQLIVIRKAIPMEFHRKDRIARLHVGTARQKVFQNIGRLVINFRKIKTKGSHKTYSGIYDIPMNDQSNRAVGMQLAMVASGNLYPAEEPKKGSS